ncbi:hypothetical protein NDU88_002077 [Pleurodeles waltl]|uniref:Uncharacterized protein n=1 Tax=Pleurodeles waltl TaxID=8319 RepID=A0AAV7WK80_PLEWA|nr:hypothetical protein NDU88_002077 [Pleurodeles waltl]
MVCPVSLSVLVRDAKYQEYARCPTRPFKTIFDAFWLEPAVGCVPAVSRPSPWKLFSSRRVSAEPRAFHEYLEHAARQLCCVRFQGDVIRAPLRFLDVHKTEAETRY